MPLASSTPDRFFMTRQSANLMEDLDRQIHKSGAVCLLYGINGVGKTRLLEEFISTRLANQRKLMLRFNVQGDCETYPLGDSNFSQQAFSKHVLKNIEADSILVLDQFEYASNEVLHQLFQFWKSASISQELKLIICGTRQVVTDLSNLSSQFQLDINSVELKPLDAIERIEFIGSRLCPDSRSYAEMSSKLKKLIKHSDGLFSHLETLAAQQAEQITCTQKPPLKRFKFPAFSLPLLLGIVLLLSIALLSEQSVDRVIQSPVDNEPASIAKSQDNSSIINAHNRKIDPQQPLLDSPARLSDSKQDKLEISDVSVRQETLVVAEKGSQAGEDIVIQQSLTTDMQSSPLDPHVQSVLQQRIQATDHWLATTENLTASIQIMTVSANSNSLDALSLYLEKLNLRGIDLENVFIYSAPRENTKIYGVLFGSYASKKQAIKSIGSLPEGLKANQPVPRTVKGIKAEIDKNRML